MRNKTINDRQMKAKGPVVSTSTISGSGPWALIVAFTRHVANWQLPRLQQYILIKRASILVDHDCRRASGWHGNPPQNTLAVPFRPTAINFTIPVAKPIAT